jgi:hypothetical protein
MSFMDHKPAKIEDIPVLDVERLGRTPWDPRTNPDGTIPSTPLIARLFLGLWDKRYRRGGMFGH